MRYLNHAGTSYPKPDVVHRAVSQALQASPSKQRELLEAATQVILSEFQCPGELLLSSGCTAGLALVLQRLPHRELVVTSQLEHEALLQPVKSLVQQGSVSHRELQYRPGAPVDLAQLETLLGSGRVGVVAVASASNITGELMPLAEISSLTQRYDARLVVDAAQSFGTDHFLLVCEYADVIVAGGHKAAQGPQGVGVIFTRSHVDFLSPGGVCEIGEFPCETGLGFCDVGSLNVAGACGLAAGLQSTRGRRQTIANHTRGLARELRDCLARCDSIRVLGPISGDVGLPIVSVSPKTLRLERVEDMLAREGLVVRVGTHCAPQALEVLGASEGCVRFSFGETSDAGDVARIVDFFARH